MNKVTEYMAFTKAMVVFDLRETRYSAQDAAVYARPKDARGCARKIAFLLDDEQLRLGMDEYRRQRMVTQVACNHSKPELL